MIVGMIVIISGAVYAYPVSMGGGLVFGTGSTSLDWDMNRFKTSDNAQGVSLFIDTNYVSLLVDIMSGSWDLSGRYSPFEKPAVEPDPDEPVIALVPPTSLDRVHIVKSYSATLLNLNLIFKFPLPLYGLETVHIFPILGAGYQISQIVENETMFSGTYNEIKVLFGMGGDFDISDRVYLRFMAIPYYHLTKTITTDIVEEIVGSSWGAHGGFGANGYIMAGFRFGRSPQASAAQNVTTNSNRVANTNNNNSNNNNDNDNNTDNDNDEGLIQLD